MSGYEFGEYFKELRLKAGYGLRKFAGLIEMPAPNLSAIEHGRRPIPDDKLVLAAEVMGLEKGSEEWNRLFDLSKGTNALPADLVNIAGRRFIPALLRTIDNKQLTDEEIQRLIEEIEVRDGGSQEQSGR